MLERHESRESLQKQQAIDEIEETRLVQKTLRAAFSEEQIHLSPQAAPDVSNNESNNHILSKKPLASSSVLPNAHLRDKIIERIQGEKDAQQSSVRQITEDRRVRSMAKQSTWKSVSSQIQRQISQKSIRGEPIPDQSEKMVRMESAYRRRLINHMNEKIRIKNMQSIYRLKPNMAHRQSKRRTAENNQNQLSKTPSQQMTFEQQMSPFKIIDLKTHQYLNAVSSSVLSNSSARQHAMEPKIID